MAGEHLRALLHDREPAVRLQAIIALGRIGDPAAVTDLIPQVAEQDVFLAQAARTALERIGDWKQVARGLSSPDPMIRAGILLTLERVYQIDAMKALATHASSSTFPADERARAVKFLASVHRKAPPWDGRWWGTQPARNTPPAKSDRLAGYAGRG